MISCKDLITVPYQYHQYWGSYKLWDNRQKFGLCQSIESSSHSVVPLLLESPDDFKIFQEAFTPTDSDLSMMPQPKAHGTDQSFFDSMSEEFRCYLSHVNKCLLVITHIPEQEGNDRSVYWSIGASQFHTARGYPFCYPDNSYNTGRSH